MLIRLFRWYSNLIGLLAVLGIALVVLVFLKRIPLVSIVNVGGNSLRNFYGIGYTWPNTWVGEYFGLERLQSYSDEAGTFAFAAIPAALLSHHYNQKWKLAIILVAIFLTFSVGAWAFIVVAGCAYYLRNASWVRRIGLMTALAVVGAAVGITIAQNKVIVDFVTSYASAKVNAADEHSSAQDRIDDLKEAAISAGEHPFGVGINGYRHANVALAVGWIVPLVEAGILGWVLYLAAFGILVVKSWQVAWHSHGLASVLACIILCLAFAALQRGGMDATVWHWFWIVAFLRFYDQPSLMLQHVAHDYR
jgi:hypothetical protein